MGENVQKAKHLADQQQQKDLRRQGNYPMQTPLVAPLTSNKAFNERYRQNPTQNNPIVQKPSHVPSNSITDSIAAGLAAAASAMNKRFNPLTMPAVDPFADTPPLTAAVPVKAEDEIPMLRLDDDVPVSVAPVPAAPAPAPPPKTTNTLRRVHSLALSDIDGTAEVEFVNPFDDESNIEQPSMGLEL